MIEKTISNTELKEVIFNSKRPIELSNDNSEYKNIISIENSIDENDEEELNSFSPMLLNYVEATNINGTNYITVYTEVDNNFKVGDKVYIVNGLYDSNVNIQYDTYRIGRDGYDILMVDNCKIVLNLIYEKYVNGKQFGNIIHKSLGNDYKKIFVIKNLNEYRYFEKGYYQDYQGDDTYVYVDFDLVRYNIPNTLNITNEKFYSYKGDFDENITINKIEDIFTDDKPVKILNSDFKIDEIEYIKDFVYIKEDGKIRTAIEYLTPYITKSNFRYGSPNGDFNGGLLGQSIKRVTFDCKDLTWNIGSVISSRVNELSMFDNITLKTSHYSEIENGIVKQKSNVDYNNGYGYNYAIYTIFELCNMYNGSYYNNIFHEITTVSDYTLSLYVTESATESNTSYKGYYNECDINKSKFNNSIIKKSNIIGSSLYNDNVNNSYLYDVVSDNIIYNGDDLFTISVDNIRKNIKNGVITYDLIFKITQQCYNYLQVGRYFYLKGYNDEFEIYSYFDKLFQISYYDKKEGKECCYIENKNGEYYLIIHNENFDYNQKKLNIGDIFSIICANYESGKIENSTWNSGNHNELDYVKTEQYRKENTSWYSRYYDILPHITSSDFSGYLNESGIIKDSIKSILLFDNTKILKGVFNDSHFDNCIIRNDNLDILDKDYDNLSSIRDLVIYHTMFDNIQNNINKKINSSNNNIDKATYYRCSFIDNNNQNNNNYIGAILDNCYWDTTDMIFSDGLFKYGTWIDGIFTDGYFYKNKSFNRNISDYITTSNNYYYDVSYTDTINYFDTNIPNNKRYSWRNGTFSGGIFEDSDWENGEFIDGNFIKSNYYSGTISGGFFGNDKLDTQDTWIFSATISDIVVNNAYFYATKTNSDNRYVTPTASIIWNSGIFNDGEFGCSTDSDSQIKAVWNNGVFNGGRFISYGQWNNGIFNNGKFLSGYYYSTLSQITYNSFSMSDFYNANNIVSNKNNYSWRDGEFNGGEFGIEENQNGRPSWFKGEFNDGIFRGRLWYDGEFRGGNFYGVGNDLTMSDGITISYIYDKDTNNNITPKKIEERYIPYKYENDLILRYAKIGGGDDSDFYGLWLNGNVVSNTNDNKSEIIFRDMLWCDGTIDNQYATIENSVWIGGEFNSGIFKQSSFNPYRISPNYGDLTMSSIEDFTISDNETISYLRDDYWYTYTTLTNDVIKNITTSCKVTFSESVSLTISNYPTKCVWNNGTLKDSDFYFAEWNDGLYDVGDSYAMLWNNGVCNYMNAFNIYWENGIWKNGNWYGANIIYDGKLINNISFERVMLANVYERAKRSFVWNIFKQSNLMTNVNDIKLDGSKKNNTFDPKKQTHDTTTEQANVLPPGSINDWIMPGKISF